MRESNVGSDDARQAEHHNAVKSKVERSINAERVLNRSRVAARGSQFLDYAFYLVYGLLAIRLVLPLIGPRSGSGFVRFINVLTGPFHAPFRGIVSSPSVDGGFTLVGQRKTAI